MPLPYREMSHNPFRPISVESSQNRLAGLRPISTHPEVQATRWPMAFMTHVFAGWENAHAQAEVTHISYTKTRHLRQWCGSLQIRHGTKGFSKVPMATHKFTDRPIHRIHLTSLDRTLGIHREPRVRENTQISLTLVYFRSEYVASSPAYSTPP